MAFISSRTSCLPSPFAGTRHFLLIQYLALSSFPRWCLCEETTEEPFFGFPPTLKSRDFEQRNFESHFNEGSKNIFRMTLRKVCFVIVMDEKVSFCPQQSTFGLTTFPANFFFLFSEMVEQFRDVNLQELES